jgi:hypothetical protein
VCLPERVLNAHSAIPLPLRRRGALDGEGYEHDEHKGGALHSLSMAD